MGVPTWAELLQRFLPFNVFEDLRDDLCDLFEEAYEAHPSVQQRYAPVAVSEMQDDAKSRATEALAYRPSNLVTRTKSLVSGLNSIFTIVFAVLAVIGFTVGIGFLSYIARVGLGLLQSVEGILLSFVLGGSGVLGILSFVFLLWLKAIAASSPVVEAFNQELVIGPQHVVRTNDKAELVGIIVWNDSLIGPGAMKLVNIFSIFWILSAFPGWNPYEFILNTVEEHMDVFVEVDGYWEAGQVLWGRMMGGD